MHWYKFRLLFFFFTGVQWEKFPCRISSLLQSIAPDSLCLIIKLISFWQTGIYSLLRSQPVSMIPLKNNQQTCFSSLWFQEGKQERFTNLIVWQAFRHSTSLTHHGLYTSVSTYQIVMSNYADNYIKLQAVQITSDIQKSLWTWINGN